jgi:hypothetical protein
VVVEVGVDAQEAAVLGPVNAAAHVIRIRDQSLDSGHILQKLDEWPRVERVKDRLGVGRQAVGIERGLEVFVAA